MPNVHYTTDPVTGPVTFDLDGDGAAVSAEVTIDPDASAATAELSGPADLTDAARISLSGRTWTLTLPRTRATGNAVIRASGNVITGGSFTGAVIMTGGGRVLVDGVDVTAAAAGPAAGPVRLAVRLPAGSSLAARTAAGQITARGELAQVNVTTAAADLDVDIAETLSARSVSGDIRAGTVDAGARLHSISGDIRVDATAGPVTAETVSGDITCCVIESVTVDASSVSGDIDITASTGAVRPDVRARSVSGHVRTH
jgi:hypothetical protein